MDFGENEGLNFDAETQPSVPSAPSVVSEVVQCASQVNKVNKELSVVFTVLAVVGAVGAWCWSGGSLVVVRVSNFTAPGAEKLYEVSLRS